MIDVLSKNSKKFEALLVKMISYLQPSIKELSLVSKDFELIYFYRMHMEIM